MSSLATPRAATTASSASVRQNRGEPTSRQCPRALLVCQSTSQPGRSTPAFHSSATLPLVGISAALMLLASPALAVEGEATFQRNCAACHMGGGNTVQAGATLKKGDLVRNGVMDVDAVYKIVYSGKGKMYGLGEGCTPKGKCAFGARLNDVDVQAVSEYTIQKAEEGW